MLGTHQWKEGDVIAIHSNEAVLDQDVRDLISHWDFELVRYDRLIPQWGRNARRKHASSEREAATVHGSGVGPEARRQEDPDRNV